MEGRRVPLPDAGFRPPRARGETFVIAGDRFAIGSSREMSPAGLEGRRRRSRPGTGVICGQNMGDIFRRNAFNLGLHVVQCPEAVADARDGDEFTFDPQSREIVNVTQRPDLCAGAAVPQGRGHPAEWRDLRRRAARVPIVGRTPARRRVSGRGPGRRDDVDRADRLGAPRGQGPRARRPAARRDAARVRRSAAGVRRHGAVRHSHVQPDYRRRDDFSAAGRHRQRPFRLHRQATRTKSRRRSAGRSRRSTASEKPYYATPGDGIFHFYFPEQGLVLPGQFIPGADSHSRAYGAYGAVGIGVGSTTLGFGWSTGYIYFTLARQRRVVFTGRLNRRGSAARTSSSSCCGAGGRAQSQGMSVEFVDAGQQLPMVSRNTIANMMAEAEALNGIFAPDELTAGWYRSRRDTPSCRIRWSSPARTRSTPSTRSFNLSDVAPMIAKPFSPGNAFPAGEVARERITFDKALIGSCTNGSYDDLLQAALVVRARARSGARQGGARIQGVPRIRRRRPADRAAGPAARRRVDRRRVPVGRRRDPAIVVRAVLRAGRGRALAGPARDHVVQPELAESHGPWGRGLSRQPRGRRRLGAHRIHGAPRRARPRVETELYGV